MTNTNDSLVRLRITTGKVTEYRAGLKDDLPEIRMMDMVCHSRLPIIPRQTICRSGRWFEHRPGILGLSPNVVASLNLPYSLGTKRTRKSPVT
jgi:hypothetical protein